MPTVVRAALVLGALLWGLPPAAAQSLAVAAASDLQGVLPGLARDFERASGYGIQLTFGSSGNFVSQIRNGAPFDVLLSADVEYPQALIAGGKADPSSLREYARGRLVVWSRRGAGMDLRRGLEITTDAAVRRIAIANPAHAPYGRAAVAALTAAGLYDRVRHKLVLGENVSQAAQFAQSGNAQVGLLALSIALTPVLKEAGEYVLVPDSSHPPIRQAAVVVSASQRKTQAQAFIAFLESDAAEGALRAFGFTRSR